MRNKRRNKRIALYLCMGLLFTTAGCSNSTVDSDSSTADTINYSDVIDTNAEEINHNSPDSSGENTDNQSDNSVENDDSQLDDNKDSVQQADTAQAQADSIQSQTDSAQLSSTSELDGDIESIGDHSVVIRETLHPSEELAVSSDQLVTAYFTEETEFEVRTVRNGGVNGDADIEKRQGSFSDLEQNASISMTGYYDENDFHAEQVIIYFFV